MKYLVTHFLSAAIGFFVAAMLFLFLSSMASVVWQNDIKIRAAFLLQRDGAKAARIGDWPRVEQMFRASGNIQEIVQPTQWDILYPVRGWQLLGLVEYPDRTFSFPNLCIEAYSLKMQGKIEEANGVYARLTKLYPSKDQGYFDAVAQQSLHALSGGPGNDKGP